MNGLARCDQMGSVKMWRVPLWLDQDSGMVDECDVEGVAFHGRRAAWMERSSATKERGEGPGRLVRFQRMASEKAAGLRGVWIEEALAVKVRK